MNQISLDSAEAIPALWGLTAAQFTSLFVPLSIAVAIATTLAFAVVAVFAKRWRLGLVILGAGMFLAAAPMIVAGLRMDATAAEIGWQLYKIWWPAFPFFVVFFSALAWVARWLWDDLGHAFEAILDRWGERAAWVFVAVVLAGYAVHFAIR